MSKEPTQGEMKSCWVWERPKVCVKLVYLFPLGQKWYTPQVPTIKKVNVARTKIEMKNLS